MLEMQACLFVQGNAGRGGPVEPALPPTSLLVPIRVRAAILPAVALQAWVPEEAPLGLAGAALASAVAWLGRGL